jgi:maltose-binding protein MalE
MSKQKNVFLAALLILVMSILAACGGGASSGNANSANLTVWGMGAERR